jgi:hypothetical protein
MNKHKIATSQRPKSVKRKEGVKESGLGVELNPGSNRDIVISTPVTKDTTLTPREYEYFMLGETAQIYLIIIIIAPT